MNINDRMIFDDTELFQFLEAQLDKLQPFNYDGKYKQLLGDNIINKINLWSKNIRKQKDVPLTVVVCGEFKRGKSSLINAILGEHVVTTNINTETITVNRISYGEHSNEIILKGGKRVQLTDDELNCDKLSGILKEISAGDAITSLNIKRPIEILKDITIIDTPGLGDSLKDFSEDVEFALTQADAVIYVFSAMYPLSIQEQFFIKTAIKPQKYTELFLVANYCDMLDCEEDCNRVRETILGRLNDILPGEEPYMISALDERCKQLGNQIPKEELSDYLSENFARLRTNIDTLIKSKRVSVIPDRIERMLNAMMEDISVDIHNINLSLSLSMDELKKKKEDVAKEKQQYSDNQQKLLESIDLKLATHRGETTEWISQFVSLLEQDVDNLSKIPTDDIRRYYSVFCVDAMQNALNACNEYFFEAIFDEVENISVQTAKKLSMNHEDANVAFKFSANNKNFTKGDKVAFAGSFLQTAGNMNLSFISKVLLDFVAGSMRNKEIKKNTPNLIEEIRDQYPQLKASVIPAVAENYKKISEDAKKQLVDYFADKKTELDDQLSQAEVISRQDEAKKLEIKAAVDEISAILESIRSELNV